MALSKKPNLTKTKVGSWTVIRGPIKRRSKANKYGKWYHLCKCSCGAIHFVLTHDLQIGRSKRCNACRNIRMKTNPPAFKDKKKYRRLRRCWTDMLSRCYNPKDRGFSSYGEQGITVHVSWWEFIPFKLWSLSHGYTDSLTIDRIDGTKSYSPLNCRWATCKQQNRNKKNNHYYTAFGETKLLPEWVEDNRCIVSFSTLDNRINRDNWNIEHALIFPKNSGSTYNHMKKRYLLK